MRAEDPEEVSQTVSRAGATAPTPADEAVLRLLAARRIHVLYPAGSPHCTQAMTRLREALLGSAPFVPRNPREMGHFTALSVAAGTCEEILYRGFLIWYVCTFTGTTFLGVGLAVVLTSATFAVCHLYQGPANAVRVGMLSLVLGTLYVVAGSLWVVMAFHATIDVAIGAVALLVLRAPTPGAASDG